MAKRYPINKIKKDVAYSLSEVAVVVGVQRRTVTRWVNEGLIVLDANKKPVLVMGYILKEFLINKSMENKVSLKKDEIYCVACSQGVQCDMDKLELNFLGKNKSLPALVGRCKKCKNKIFKYISQEEVRSIRKCIKTAS